MNTEKKKKKKIILGLPVILKKLYYYSHLEIITHFIKAKELGRLLRINIPRYFDGEWIIRCPYPNAAFNGEGFICLTCDDFIKDYFLSGKTCYICNEEFESLNDIFVDLGTGPEMICCFECSERQWAGWKAFPLGTECWICNSRNMGGPEGKGFCTGDHDMPICEVCNEYDFPLNAELEDIINSEESFFN